MRRPECDMVQPQGHATPTLTVRGLRSLLTDADPDLAVLLIGDPDDVERSIWGFYLRDGKMVLASDAVVRRDVRKDGKP